MDPAAAHGFFAAADPVAAFCADPILWGPLAGNEALRGAVRAAQVEVQRFVGG
jgi:D-arabinitol 4-dehydrogenase